MAPCSYFPFSHSLIFGPQKINLHQAGKEFEPKAATALPGTSDLVRHMNMTSISLLFRQATDRGISHSVF
jgi:hypothetical protein